MADRTCSIDGCERKNHARGWCRRHYGSWLKRGSATAVDDTPLRKTVDDTGEPTGTCPSNASYNKGCRCDGCRSAAREYHREWRENNRERWTELATRGNRKYRASKRGALSEAYTKSEILARDGNKCGLCGKKINPRHAYPHPMSASIDHIVPLSDGGTDLRSNVQSSHLVCNVSKGKRPRGEQLRLVG